MSTKTLRKRIALVAVAGLGFGLLSATTASATTIANINIAMVEAASGTASIGVCYQAAGAIDDDFTETATAVSTTTVIEVGASLSFLTVTTGEGTLEISGPAKWSAISGVGTISSDRLTATLTSAAQTATLTASATGSLTVTAVNLLGTAAVETYGITVVASCAGSAISVANTVATLTNSNDSATSTSIDDVLVYADVDNGSDLWINVLLRDAYKNELGTAGVLTASATNGARLGWYVTSSLSGPFAAAMAVVASTGDSADSMSLKIMQPTGSSAALSTTVTIQFNGVTVATKSATIRGAAASIAVTDVTVGSYGNAGEFSYVLKDAAGNQLTETPSASAAIAGFVSGGVVAGATTTGASDWKLKADGTFTCVDGESGSQSVTLAYLNASLKAVTSNTFTATCGLEAVDTFTVSTDKVVYAPGEIATLTISAKDENGGIVADTTIVGTDVVNVAMPGMTPIGAAATSADTFTSGKATYKFRVDQAEGSFVGQAQVTAATDTAVKTLQYQIKASSGAIGMADVLKAIVSLIASINKQIAALQKALLKKK